jgi:23S rRNA (pseudouridine1915-N3)-methyltransferase
MKWTLAHIAPRSKSEYDALVSLYLDRCTPVARCDTQSFKSEAAFLESLDRSRALPVLADSRGRSLTSEAFAAWLGARRDEGRTDILFAIGPADGWSDIARARAHLLLSLSSFTLAHALARLVLAEQLYRATTILTGHPYHSGH